MGGSLEEGSISPAGEAEPTTNNNNVKQQMSRIMLEIGVSGSLNAVLATRLGRALADARQANFFSRLAYFCRNFATFGATTAAQYGWLGLFVKYS